ncbi:MAG: hypothetical protein DHS20C02_18900 [Micavibrio sp.]|nr:MAG: hypothetical protein DHS20C02_18900 [Micavibrio sp.]
MENENTGKLPAPTNQAADEKDRAEITALSTDLERILENPSPHLTSLERQGDLLDCLLYAVMRHNLNKDKENGTFSAQSLEMALRIQKQSMDTMKTSSTVEYMNCIASASTGVYPARVYSERAQPLPPPGENE